MKYILAALLSILLLSPSLCQAMQWVPSYSERYRITVTVETPEGLKTGSAVREVSRGGTLLVLPEQTIPTQVDGEAVAVDLGPRGVLFALMEPDGGYGIDWKALKDFRLNTKLAAGTKVTLPPSKFSGYRLFRDLSGPWGAEDVDSAPEIKIKDVTLEITDAPVTRTVEKLLPWLPCLVHNESLPADMSKNWQLLDARRQYAPDTDLNNLSFQGYVNGQEDQKKKTDCSSFWAKQVAADRAGFQEELKHWQPLADQGDAEAQFKTGNLHRYGDGHDVAPDPVAALKWYRLAADQGYQDAQAKLGHVYEYREGVPQDWQEAYFWALLAAKGTGGHNLTNNADALNNAPRHITPEQKAAAEKRAREWKPTPALPTIRP